MFIIFDKQKIYSYLVALSTVVVLFVIAFAVTNQSSSTLQTSVNIEESNSTIYNQLENINQNNTIETNQNNTIKSNKISNEVDN